MNLLAAWRERVWLAEGAMGTRLLSRGVAFGRCLEELNLSRPTLVQEVHSEYVDAGAQILKTNTIGANPGRLAQHGLESECRAINRAGVRIARAAAGDSCLVGGVVGPMGDGEQRDARAAFQVQIQALAEAGADFILLETFRDLGEIGDAILAARAACHLPVVAQVSPDACGNLRGGIGPETYVPQLDGWGAAAIGCNCGVGLAATMETVKRFALLTDKPLTAQPSAGIPAREDNKLVYPEGPEDFEEVGEQMLRCGTLRIVGGCCGTTPEHIAALRRAIDALGAPWTHPAARPAASGRDYTG